MKKDSDKNKGCSVCGGNMLAVESMIGQIAHDFNNLLTPLIAYPQLIKMDLPDDSSSHGLLESIEEATGNMVYITRQLLALSPRGDGDKERIGIDFIFRNILAWLEEIELSGYVDTNVMIPEESVAVLGNENDIFMATQSLCLNAIEAVENKAGSANGSDSKFRVGLSCDFVEDKGRETRCGLKLSPGRYVRIVVSDEGCGMTEEVIRQIFTPFFTTKRGEKKKRGAGLGLNIAYRVARDNAGAIDFDSSDAGSTFALYFPAV